jgi:hypothetical protein
MNLNNIFKFIKKPLVLFIIILLIFPIIRIFIKDSEFMLIVYFPFFLFFVLYVTFILFLKRKKYLDNSSNKLRKVERFFLFFTFILMMIIYLVVVFVILLMFAFGGVSSTPYLIILALVYILSYKLAKSRLKENNNKL